MSERHVFINGLPALYGELKRVGKEEKARALLKDFLKNTFELDLEDKVNRFLDIPGGLKPADMDYFKLYWELIQLYINGLFYSTVVLSGVLCERVCYDVLSKAKIRIEEREVLSEDDITCLYKMNLYDLIMLLEKWKLIKGKTKANMIEINNKRNSYVHPTKSRTLDARKDSFDMIRRISGILENEFVVESMQK